MLSVGVGLSPGPDFVEMEMLNHGQTVRSRSMWNATGGSQAEIDLQKAHMYEHHWSPLLQVRRKTH